MPNVRKEENTMRLFLLGFEDSSTYDTTTSYKIAQEGNFIFRKGLSKKDNYCSNDVLIRYGDYSYASYDKYFGTVINPAISIFQNINKLETHLKLFKKGLRVPKIFFSKNQISKKDLPVIKRNKYHSRASDIIIIKNTSNFTEGDFYTQLIDSDEEYRLFIIFNQCCRISKKVPIEPTSKIIRSSSTGWSLEDKFKMNIEALNEAIPLCIEALKILKLDFGACDVIVEKKTNLPYLLEVNTSPRLNKYGRQVLIKEIYEHLGIPLEGIKLNKVKEWEYQDIVPMKYREAREDFGLKLNS
jgi:hypothetical protein